MLCGQGNCSESGAPEFLVIAAVGTGEVHGDRVIPSGESATMQASSINSRGLFMRFIRRRLTLLALSIALAGHVQGQQPPVTDIYRKYDSNRDGVLEATEVSGSRYARQFPRWDVDGDAKVPPEEVIAFRKRFGIAADGTMLRPNGPAPVMPKFTVPEISDLKRISKGTRLMREDARNSAFVLSTEHHPVAGTGYVILTDHSDVDFVEPLRKLAQHHQGQILTVPDLAALHGQQDQFSRLQKQMREMEPRFVAIAPRLDSFRENMVLGMWELFSTLDEDPEIDVFPGFLVASNPSAFAALIEQSLKHDSVFHKDLKPLAVSQVLTNVETRSLQKAAMLRKHFSKSNLETPIVAVYGNKATTAPRLEGAQVWNLKAPGAGKFIESFSSDLSDKFDESNLIIMHGHGVPGMSCSVDNQGIPADLHGKVLMTGSCFSASPRKSDLPEMRDAPGGFTVEKRDAFILKAVDQGALVAFGHQRLSSGFPHLYPVLESWLQGDTVGEGYQQLLNALIDFKGFQAGDFVVRQPSKKPPQNVLLYVVIGDPALQPFVRP